LTENVVDIINPPAFVFESDAVYWKCLLARQLVHG